MCTQQDYECLNELTTIVVGNKYHYRLDALSKQLKDFLGDIVEGVYYSTYGPIELNDVHNLIVANKSLDIYADDSFDLAIRFTNGKFLVLDIDSVWCQFKSYEG